MQCYVDLNNLNLQKVMDYFRMFIIQYFEISIISLSLLTYYNYPCNYDTVTVNLC